MLTLATGGCASSGVRAVPAGQRLDRLIRRHPELRSGRFVVIADFEDPRHMELVRLSNVSAAARCVLDARGGEDGGHGLLFEAGSDGDAVVFSNRDATRWALKRDWRAYDLFLLSVHAPNSGLALELDVTAGPAADRSAVHTSLPLVTGWNRLRLDIAEIGERIPLDDVRELRFAVSGVRGTVSIRLDDLVLTADRGDLISEWDKNGDRGLYARRVGRRWHIGHSGDATDFELTLADGQIVSWYRLASDPHRLRNLLPGAMLGPIPVPLADRTATTSRTITDSAATSTSLVSRDRRRVVAVETRILEANPVRVVAECTWRWAKTENPRKDSRSAVFRRWIYTIYPTGQVYARVEARPDHDDPVDRAAALAVRLDRWDSAVIHVAGEPTSPATTSEMRRTETSQRSVFATARATDHDALLLFAPHEPNTTLRVVVAPDDARESRRVATGDNTGAYASSPRILLAVGKKSHGRWRRWSCHFLLAKSSAISRAEAQERAGAYAGPVIREISNGGGGSGGSGASADGSFDAGSGCFEITAGPTGVRWVIGDEKRPQFSPAFRVLNSAGRKGWVYVNQLLLQRVARDSQGNLIFQIPGVIREPTIVEVLLAAGDA